MFTNAYDNNMTFADKALEAGKDLANFAIESVKELVNYNEWICHSDICKGQTVNTTSICKNCGIRG